MFKFLAKSAIASLIWTKYRQIIVSTVILFAVYFLIAFLHSDFLTYASVSGSQTNIAISFIVKWAALILATVIYYYTNRHIKPQKSKRRQNTTSSSISQQSKPPNPSTSPAPNTPDPFARIRTKTKLKSKVDQALKE